MGDTNNLNEWSAYLDGKQKVVLCQVVATTGSTPRKAGAKMLVFADGSIRGTIGGGNIEYQVLQEALQMMPGSEPRLKVFHLLNDLGMQCGGNMQVYLERYGGQPRLYIFGGGHIGKALAGLTPDLGFDTTLLDQRQGIFDHWAKAGVQVRVGELLPLADSIETGPDCYIVIVTHQHQFDEGLLIHFATKPWAYLGMIGSRAKVGVVRKNAIEQLQIPTEVLDRINMPIGIPFAAQTPEEIAISIAAKLIDVKNSRP